jgi:hypothetical protein
MIALETVESLNAYTDRLHRDRVRFSRPPAPRRATVRELVRRVRRSG